MFELLIEITGDEDLKKLYQNQIIVKDKTYSYMHSDSGFDLFTPKDVKIGPRESKMVDLEIKCEPKFAGGYYLYPRSSFGKTPLRLKHSVGIIDNSYRNSVKALVENMSDSETFEMKAGERYFQLCHPTLIAMKVIMVEKVSHSTRGAGFGSSGK
jgi:deoxyuridine 5'-triphosphate nucleotidohydrolase